MLRLGIWRRSLTMPLMVSHDEHLAINSKISYPAASGRGIKATSNPQISPSRLLPYGHLYYTRCPCSTGMCCQSLQARQCLKMTNRQDRRIANYIPVVCPVGASCAVQIRSGRICANLRHPCSLPRWGQLRCPNSFQTNLCTAIAARRVASTAGRNEGNEKSHFFISVSAYVPRRAFLEVPL